MKPGLLPEAAASPGAALPRSAAMMGTLGKNSLRRPRSARGSSLPPCAAAKGALMAAQH